MRAAVRAEEALSLRRAGLRSVLAETTTSPFAGFDSPSFEGTTGRVASYEFDLTSELLHCKALDEHQQACCELSFVNAAANV